MRDLRKVTNICIKVVDLYMTPDVGPKNKPRAFIEEGTSGANN